MQAITKISNLHDPDQVVLAKMNIEECLAASKGNPARLAALAGVTPLVLQHILNAYPDLADDLDVARDMQTAVFEEVVEDIATATGNHLDHGDRKLQLDAAMKMLKGRHPDFNKTRLQVDGRILNVNISDTKDPAELIRSIHHGLNAGKS